MTLLQIIKFPGQLKKVRKIFESVISLTYISCPAPYIPTGNIITTIFRESIN